MNRLVLVVLAAILFMPATFAQTESASAAVHAPTVKIGWISVDDVIFTCDEGARMIADIQKFVDTKNAELEAIRQEVNDLNTRLEVQGTKLTDEARMDLEERLIERQTYQERFSQDTQRDIENRKNRVGNIVSRKMGPVIEKVALAKGLDAIEIYNPSRDVWINPALNVTKDVIDAYNQAYPVGAPTVPAAAKKP